MRIKDLLQLSISNLFKRKLRTILTVLGVTIGVASIVVMVSLGLGLKESLTASMESYSSLNSVTVQDASNGYYYFSADGEESKVDENLHLDDNAVETIRQMDKVVDVIPMLSINAMVKSGAYEGYVTIYGVPDNYLQSQGVKLEDGDYFTTTGGMPSVVYGNMIPAEFYNPKTNSGYWYDGVMANVDLTKDPIFFILDQDAYWQYQNGGTGEDGTVVQKPKKYLFGYSGLIEGGTESYNSYCYDVYCSLDDLKPILKKEFKGKVIPGQPTTASGKPYKEIFYSKLIVQTASMDDVEAVQNALRDMGYQTYSDAEWIEQDQKIMGYIQLVLGGIGAVSLFVAAIGIANTMMMSIYERTKEIGIMKVLGCDMRNIQAMFLVEAGGIGFFGGVTGLVISYVLSFVINILTKGMMDSADMTAKLSQIPVWLALFSLVFAILVGMLAGFFPSLRAMKLSPLAAIRNE